MSCLAIWPCRLFSGANLPFRLSKRGRKKKTNRQQCCTHPSLVLGRVGRDCPRSACTHDLTHADVQPRNGGGGSCTHICVSVHPFGVIDQHFLGIGNTEFSRTQEADQKLVILAWEHDLAMLFLLSNAFFLQRLQPCAKLGQLGGPNLCSLSHLAFGHGRQLRWQFDRAAEIADSNLSLPQRRRACS